VPDEAVDDDGAVPEEDVNLLVAEPPFEAVEPPVEPDELPDPEPEAASVVLEVDVPVVVPGAEEVLAAETGSGLLSTLN
jgi:hypothetical protein